jgi:protein-S-isoprenylcysteine O-methyltransferase Ste14
MTEPETPDVTGTTTRLPALGPRGEGWVVIQGVLLVAVAAAGWLGPAWDGTLRLLGSTTGIALMLAGLWLAVRGIKDLRGALTPLPYPRPGSELVETGVYALVRHPIYGGLVIAGIGWGLLTASPAAIAAALVLLGFFQLKSRREEAWLEGRFPGYAAYRARTRRLIPWIG